MSDTVRLSDLNQTVPDMSIGADERGQVVPIAPDADVPELEIETWSEFYDKAGEEIPCIIDDLWPEAAFGFVASPPKKGKTWVGLSLAVSLATGRTFLDRFDIPEPRPVLYVALEGHRSALAQRTGAIARGLGIDPEQEIDGLHFVYKPRSINIADPVWAESLRRAARSVEAALVVVDVLRAAARLKENDATEFAALRANLQPLTADNVSVALLHHFTKLSETSKERTPGERMSGSGAMYGALDVAIYITGSDDGARKLRLEFEARDISSPATLGARLEGVGTGPNGGLTANDRAWWVAADAPDRDDVEMPAEEIIEWLQQHGPATRYQVASYFKKNERTVKRREIRMAQLGVKITGGGSKGHPITYTAPDPERVTALGDTLGDTCQPIALSPLNPSIHAGSSVSPDKGDNTTLSPKGNRGFAGISKGDKGDTLRVDDPVSGNPPELAEEPTYDYDDGIPW